MRLKSIKIIVALTLLAGVALFLISNLLNYSDKEIVSQIESNLTNESTSLAAHLDLLKSEVEKGSQDFTSYNYPSFLFSNSKLVAWNHNEFDVSDLLIKANDQTEIVNIRNSLLTYRKTILKRDSVDYILLSFFPIATRYPFNNKYLPQKMNASIFPEGVTLLTNKSASEGLPIFFEQKPAFEITSENDKVYGIALQRVIQILTVLFTVGLFISVFLISQRLAKSQHQSIGLLILVFIVGLSRGLMIMYNFPNAYLNMDLFRSRIFMSSNVNSSIGDLFLNNLSLLIIAIFLILNQDWLLAQFKRLSSIIVKRLLLIVMVVLSYFLLHHFFNLVFGLITNGQITLDVHDNVELSILSAVGYLSILLLAIFYFFINDLIYKIAFKEIDSKKHWLLILSISVILYIAVSLLLEEFYLSVLFLQSIYVLLIYFYELPIRLNKLKFGTFLYGLVAIFLIALTSSLAIYRGYEYKELVKKEKLSTKLLIDRDIEGEYLLNELIEDIKLDVFINSLFVNPQSPKKQIHERINRYFSSGYFEIYNVKIALYDKEGTSLDKSRSFRNFSETKNELARREFKSDFGDIYFQHDEVTSGRIRYVCFLNIERYQNRTGSVLLDLRLKKQVSKSVYPELLLEHRFIGKNDFDYAIYNGDELVYKVGDFNYKADFNKEWFAKNRLYTQGIEGSGNHHLGVKGQNKTIIVSSDVYSYWAMLSNFSFYFLLFTLGGIFISVIHSLITRSNQSNVSFSTKILIYIGCAFAIPIAFVGFAIIGTINKSYKSEIEKSYEKKTIAIGENIVGLVEGYLSNKENKEGIANEISKIAKTSRADINIYNTGGRLITTSQSKVFESGLLTSNINPVAFNHIVLGNKDKIVLDESIGNLTYKSSYIAIRAFEDGKLLGILSSPFFGSKNHLNRQKTEIFNSTINIATLIFIFSVWFTYLAVRRLTNPLIVIASKLKSTELKEENEPLKWETNDEIGALVQEYNRMVEKLEISKKELAKNEKEAAWREMAKQVAHEIKNPLTPMKLTLQHMDRVMDKDDPRRKSLSTLLSQVDTLDEIVTSFSHFARMPDPENVDFDIKSELEKIIHLHPEKSIVLSDLASKYLVKADKKLFGRIFNNVILNAFQAMSKKENPELKITLSNDVNKIHISFEDQGTGISEEIKEKVFVPNFSTKDSGSGIGLAVAKRGIEHAGGVIYFESKEGIGTIFYVELPIV